MFSWLTLENVVVSTILGTALFLLTGNAKPAESERPGVAVVELFTSEGCSSCPPADDFLIKLAEKRRVGDQAIFCLSYHVDYWDHLGWKDAFSSAKFSNRQRKYAEVLGQKSVYTPEMVVNGSVGFVGSDSRKGSDWVARGLATPCRSVVTMKSSEQSDDDMAIDILAIGARPEERVQLALVSNRRESLPDVGENAGQPLKHANVVLSLQTVELDDTGHAKTSVVLPDDHDPDSLTLVAFVQDPESMKISGATDLAIGD